MWTMRALALVALLALTTFWLPAGARAQTTAGAARMVVDVPQDDLYHNPACALVQAAGSKVKVMRHAEAVRRKLKPHDCAAGPDGGPADPNDATVYVQKGDSRYHKEGCSKLTGAATKTTVEEAGQKLWPCGECQPPRRQRTAKSGGA